MTTRFQRLSTRQNWTVTKSLERQRQLILSALVASG
jgi:hypothetical protein